MLQRIKSILFIFLLIFYVAILAIWLRSKFCNDWIVWRRPYGNERVAVMEVGWVDGRCYLMRSEAVFAALHTRSGSEPIGGGSGWSIWTARFDQDAIQLLGVEYWRGGSYLLHLPFYIPVLLLSGVMLVKLLMSRRKKLARPGFSVESVDAP